MAGALQRGSLGLAALNLQVLRAAPELNVAGTVAAWQATWKATQMHLRSQRPLFEQLFPPQPGSQVGCSAWAPSLALPSTLFSFAAELNITLMVSKEIYGLCWRAGRSAAILWPWRHHTRRCSIWPPAWLSSAPPLPVRGPAVASQRACLPRTLVGRASRPIGMAYDYTAIAMASTLSASKPAPHVLHVRSAFSSI